MSAANVNKPTDDKVKEADINRKLQIYGIIAAFQAGKVPSNEQIDVALNSFLASKALSNPSTACRPRAVSSSAMCGLSLPRPRSSCSPRTRAT